METEDSTEEDSPLLSESVEKEMSASTTSVSATSDIISNKKGEIGEEDTFDSLLNLKKSNPTLLVLRSYFFRLLPLVLFISTVALFSRSSLNVPQMTSLSGYNSKGGLLGQAFVGLVLIYVPGFFEWQSSIRDKYMKTTPALAFKILGWVLLPITFLIALAYSLF